MEKFGSLFADVADTARIELLHPGTGKVLRDADGTPAWIEVWPADSERGRTFDKAQRTKAAESAAKGAEPEVLDLFDVTVAKCAKLTKAWHLLDLRGRPVDTACTPENALELYSAPNPVSASFYRQVAIGVGGAANFIKASSESSSPSQSRNSELPGG